MPTTLFATVAHFRQWPTSLLVAKRLACLHLRRIACTDYYLSRLVLLRSRWALQHAAVAADSQTLREAQTGAQVPQLDRR